MTPPTFGKVSGTVRMMGVWGGDELAAFREVITAWEQQTGGKVEFEGTRDLSTVLRARVEGNNPPDIAILPNPALMQTFAQSNKLKPLSQAVDMNRLNSDYSKAWIDLGTVNGNLYGLFIQGRSQEHGLVRPQAIQPEGLAGSPDLGPADRASPTRWPPPATPPWSIGVESQATSGWPGSDWVQELYLREFGPEMYDKWVRHEIPWTDPSVKAAFQRFGQIATKSNYVAGGVQNILATSFQDASYAPFMNPPRAYLYFLGAFAQTFIAQQFPNLKAGQAYDFFPFPTINAQYQGMLTGGADVAVMFNDTEASRSFMQYMAWAGAWEPWAKKGGFTSPNKSFNQSAYPDEVAKKVGRQLTEAKTFRFDADDLMPAPVQQAEFSAVLDYLRSPNNLDSILGQVETVAKDAYRQ